MIRIKWMDLANPYFQDAVRVIWDCPMLDAPTSYSAHRIYSGVAEVEKQIRVLRMALIDKYAKKDEHGKPVTDPRGHIEFETEEKHKEFEAEFQKEFEARHLELKVSKINFQSLASVRGITPRQWEFLKPIVDNLPEESHDEPSDNSGLILDQSGKPAEIPRIGRKRK